MTQIMIFKLSRFTLGLSAVLQFYEVVFYDVIEVNLEPTKFSFWLWYSISVLS